MSSHVIISEKDPLSRTSADRSVASLTGIADMLMELTAGNPITSKAADELIKQLFFSCTKEVSEGPNTNHLFTAALDMAAELARPFEEEIIVIIVTEMGLSSIIKRLDPALKGEMAKRKATLALMQDAVDTKKEAATSAGAALMVCLTLSR
jgi:divalent metal cation (Fe/Co/Zn/Cd) transporter